MIKNKTIIFTGTRQEAEHFLEKWSKQLTNENHTIITETIEQKAPNKFELGLMYD